MANAAVFRQQLRVYTDRNLSNAARSAALASAARARLAELQEAGRVGPNYRLFVDGQSGSSEDQVRGDGTGSILYEFSYIAEAAAFALAFLRTRAPASSGRYRDSFFVAVDGRFVMARDFNASSIPPTAEIIIGNTMPYNRKADVQMAGTRRLRFSVPAGEYDDAASAVARRFGNSVTAKRLYSINFPGQYTIKQHQRRLTGRHAGKITKSAGSRVDSPALVIAPRL